MEESTNKKDRISFLIALFFMGIVT